jgi:hypothetical protein
MSVVEEMLKNIREYQPGRSNGNDLKTERNRKHNGMDDSWEVRSTVASSDEPPLLLLFLLFGLIFV